MNSIRVIHPYWVNGSLVFDDESVGLIREPFVSGADVILGLLASHVDGCAGGFALRFSDCPFPGYQSVMHWKSSEHGGNWYACEIDEATYDGWLCPALLKYFSDAPASIYLEIKSCRRTLSEIWGFSRKATDSYS